MALHVRVVYHLHLPHGVFQTSTVTDVHGVVTPVTSKLSQCQFVPLDAPIWLGPTSTLISRDGASREDPQVVGSKSGHTKTTSRAHRLANRLHQPRSANRQPRAPCGFSTRARQNTPCDKDNGRTRQSPTFDNHVGEEPIGRDAVLAFSGRPQTPRRAILISADQKIIAPRLSNPSWEILRRGFHRFPAAGPY